MDIDLRRSEETAGPDEAVFAAALAKTLGERALDDLRAVTLDGVAVPALGRAQPHRGPITRREASRPWSVVPAVDLTDPARANAEVLADLAGGADAVDLVFPPGWSEPLDDVLGRVLDGAHLDMIAVHATGAPEPLSLARALAGLGRSAGRAAARAIYVGFDPYAAPFRAGTTLGTPEAGLAPVIEWAAAEGAGPGTVLASRGDVWHALGASEAQQLGIALATGARYLALYLGGGGDHAGAARLSSRIAFRLVADQRQLVTTAKLRAFRRLWALVLDAFGLPQTPAWLHVETSWRMLSRRDPETNILRTTVAAFAAVVGGADAITTRPHTAATGVPDPAARRLARNVQLVLMAEANLHRVIDPAAGAGGQEDLADALAQAGWAEFQRIEGEGGLAASLSSGALLARIADKDAAERALVAEGKLPIVGASTYPPRDERPVLVLPGPPMAPPAAGARRLSEPFEADDVPGRGT